MLQVEQAKQLTHQALLRAETTEEEKRKMLLAVLQIIITQFQLNCKLIVIFQKTSCEETRFINLST